MPIQLQTYAPAPELYSAVARRVLGLAHRLKGEAR